MPKRVDQYRLNAVKCFELSQTFKDPDTKRALFAMAGAWLRLATHHGKNTELPASDRCSVPCPCCQSPMAWYSADLTDDRRALQHSYQCEKCGFIRQSDDQRRDIRLVKSPWLVLGIDNAPAFCRRVYFLDSPRRREAAVGQNQPASLWCRSQIRSRVLAQYSTLRRCVLGRWGCDRSRLYRNRRFDRLSRVGRGGLDSARQVVAAAQNLRPVGKRHGEYHNDCSLHACGGSYRCRCHLRRVGTPILTENCSSTYHGGGKRRVAAKQGSYFDLDQSTD